MSRWYPGRRREALVGRNGAGKSTLVAVLTGPAGARCRPGPPRRRGRAQPRRPPPAMARAGRLRLSEIDRDPDAHGRREPVPQRASDRRPRLDRLAPAAPSGRAGAGRLGPRGRRRPGCRTAHGRAAPDRRDRPRAAQGTRFIILDEPTAQLGPVVARLFERIVRLQEAASPSSTSRTTSRRSTRSAAALTVLRDGQVVANAPLAAMPKDRVVAAMVGGAVRGASAPGRRPPRRPPRRSPAWRCSGSASKVQRRTELRGRGRRDRRAHGPRGSGKSRSAMRSPGW